MSHIPYLELLTHLPDDEFKELYNSACENPEFTIGSLGIGSLGRAMQYCLWGG